MEEPKNRPKEGGTSERERATILSIERERLPVLHRCEEEKEEGEGREVKEKGCFGGTKKPDEEERAREKGKQFCQLKPLFQLQKAAFFFCNSVSYFG